MTAIPYEKYHGTENDFIVIDASAPVDDWAALATWACDPDRGIGADGVLSLALDPTTDPVTVTMTLYQPDGGTAAMCGNGARCVAHWTAQRTGAETVDIDTPAGIRRATVDGKTVTVEMGTPTFDPRAVPVAEAEGYTEPLIEKRVGPLTVTAVNTGVPHAVSIVPDVDAIGLGRIGPAVRYADAFPEGANVTLASRRDGDGFDQRTYERGVEDETRACGTGAVAIAAVAHRFGWLDTGDAATVVPPGGPLEVTIRRDGTTTLRGPVVREATGELERPPVEG
ncbi:MAG: diaminopimelate epimerase [Halobacteriales archaeon]